MPNETESVLVEGVRRFRFNDHVCIECLLGVSDDQRTGRLVQVRKGVGQFKSNLYMVRLRDGSLMTFENALIRRADDEEFMDNFYRFNGRIPPVIPPQEPHHDDSESTTYTIGRKWPETGFIIEQPAQPETPGSFTMMISKPVTTP